jgi:excisionase family DNA binding protein
MPQTPERPEELITTGVAARMLGVKTDAIRSYINSGALVAIKLPSGHYRVSRASVERLLARRTGDDLER